MIWALTFLLAMNIPPLSDGTPNRQPQLAAANGVVDLVFGSGHEVMFAQSRDGGETFSKPSVVADVPTLALGRHRGPRVAISGKVILVSAVTGQTSGTVDHAHGSPSDGNLVVWRSTDAGKIWSQPIVVNDSPASAREGLHAMAADASGHVAAAWLDLRVKGTHLYGAFSRDAGATWSKNVLLYESPDGTICQCCHPTLAALGNGEFAVMFRNFTGGNRDMYLLRLRDGRVVSQAEKLGMGSWELNACPMDGGGMAVDGTRLLTAWRRGEDLYLDQPGQREVRIGSGIDVALAAADGKSYAVWTKAGAVNIQIGARTQVLSKSGAFPVVVALPKGGAVAAWEDNGVIRTQRLAE